MKMKKPVFTFKISVDLAYSICYPITVHIYKNKKLNASSNFESLEEANAFLNRMSKVINSVPIEIKGDL